MAWLGQKRNKILESYRATVNVVSPPDIPSFQSQVCLAPLSALTVSPDLHTENLVCAECAALSTEAEITVDGIRLEPIDFTIKAQSSGLVASQEVKIQNIAIGSFPLTIHRFSFGKARREHRSSLFESLPQRAKHVSDMARVETPARPPSLHHASLEERLHWILTPPIHEILSDPQLALPERPFPFQVHGIKWLYDRENALLADEMGLGKTMQAIIAARLLWREERINQILVICPKTLISTWQTELAKWWPAVTGNVKIVGTDRLFELRLATRNITVKIINYDSLAREEPSEFQKDTYTHDLIIIDEAQRIKNAGSKTAQVVKAIKSSRRWALTGTPLENKVDDVISIFEFVRPGLLGRGDQSLVTQRIPPYMLRRRTDEVKDDLPEKNEQDVGIDLDDEHQATYDKLEKEGVVELNHKGDTITVTHVFQLITKLRQVCNFDPQTGRSAKLDYLLEDLDEIRESGRKAIIFSQFVDSRYGLKRVAERLNSHRVKTLELHGEVPFRQRESVVNTFTADKVVPPAFPVLLLNYKVGGVGLNLQAANYVFLFDRWWNPAVEDQAVKRAHRIGQTQKVFVRRFFCRHTIEERILQKLAEKRRLFRNVIDESRLGPDSMGLSEEEIFSLFNLTVRPRSKSSSSDTVTLMLDNMDSEQFELLVARLYERQGYIVHHLGGSHDGGIDILAEKTIAGATERVAIQCKHQQAKVGRPVLQQLWGVVSSDQTCTRGDLVTSSDFSAEGRAFAQGKRLTLMNCSAFMGLCREFKVAQFADV